MTDVRAQTTGTTRNRLRQACLLIPVLCLLSCTATHPPEPYLPQRSGMVPGETIRVKGNENIYGIAQDHNVSMREIIVLNGLQPPFALKTGQSLILPFKKGDVASAPMNTPEAVTSAPEAVTAAPMSAVREAPLAPITTQSLPPPTPAPASKPPAVISVAPAPVEALNAPAAPPPKPVITTLAPVAVAAAPVATSPPPAAPTNSPPPAMIWPVQGPVLSAYGPKGQGVNNDGVNIGAPKGAPVVAAANGIVVYAGNEMKGFGNLVLIRHEGGWVTAYAYLDRVLVTKDAVVAQGDMIGTVGKTGNISTPQLHFETRQDGKVVDPNGVVKGQ